MTIEEYCERICKKRPTKVQLDIMHKLEEIRNEVRNKTIEEMAQIITELYDDLSCVSGCEHVDDGVTCNHCVLEKAIMRMKEGTT